MPRMTAQDDIARSAEPARDLYEGYEAWKSWTRPFEPTADEIAYFTGETRGMKIGGAELLEIGFGSGSFLAWAKGQGARIAGTEINPRLLEAARAYGVELLPPAFETVASNNTARFDTIAAFDVFEHFEIGDVAARLSACETMLKPGGHLVMRFPNGQSPFGLVCQNGDPTHKCALSRQVVEQLILGRGFTVQRYAPSYRIKNGSLPQRVVRMARYGARSTISAILNAIYGQTIPWDPVVVLVLRKT
jgi:2-polyprenyl-3-methyl-5-hydroxy-6-metoxy-1,4-benzoquinol methylase